MKKIVSLALLLSLVFSVTACGQTVQTETDAAGNIETSKAAERAWESEEAAPTESAATDTEEETTVKAEFDFETKTVMLNSGYEMPINGLGTYSLHGDECINAVKSALSSGARLIDTASAYGNDVICCEL